MLLSFINRLSLTQQGFLSLVIGLILVLGAFDKLCIFQNFLNIFLIVLGAYLMLRGAQAANLWGKIKGLRKK
ncbi:hypothetical protein KBD08_00245 [Candidatus Babeliales bacterium]|nr:hypothetical protein [Candidatus Babeliales bacterium]